MKIKHLFVVGLGLIGSSLCLTIKKEHPDIIITGLDTNEFYQHTALTLKVIDQIAVDFATAAIQADVILLATPISQTKKLLQALSTLSLKSQVIITDVGSTKQAVVDVAKQVLPGKIFIGGHPMAGSHKSGVLAANPLLFENAYYILTPTAKLSIESNQSVDSEMERENTAIYTLMELLKGSKAKFIRLSPEKHDQITGMVSHLPHIIASGLVNQVMTYNQENSETSRLAAGGFRDITRIASSDPRMWTDILLSNQQVLLKLLDNWQQEMAQMEEWLKANDEAAIYQFFAASKTSRDSLPINQVGAIPAFYDLFVDIPDYPGILAEVTGYLAEEKISLVNIRILETREEINGILQLSFSSYDALLLAKLCLEKKSPYSCYTKENK